MTDDLAHGLGVDRLHPPAVVAFFQGLPRRVADRLTAVDAEFDGGSQGLGSITDEALDALTAIADAVVATVDRAKTLGFPIDPTADASATAWPPLSGESVSQAERIETGVELLCELLQVLPTVPFRRDAVEEPRFIVLNHEHCLSE
jgi:hypothetical protein